MQEERKLDQQATVIDLLRHGEVTGGVCLRGSTDNPLSRQGWRQMDAAVDAASWDGIISSPLRRCSDFAQALADRLAIPLRLEARLRELHFGGWEGRTPAELMRTNPEALARFWQTPYLHPPPGGESLPAFERRVLKAWRTITQDYCGRRVLLITHSGVIRVIICHLRGLPPEALLSLEVPYASLQQVVVANTSDGSAQ